MMVQYAVSLWYKGILNTVERESQAGLNWCKTVYVKHQLIKRKSHRDLKDTSVQFLQVWWWLHCWSSLTDSSDLVIKLLSMIIVFGTVFVFCFFKGGQQNLPKCNLLKVGILELVDCIWKWQKKPKKTKKTTYPTTSIKILTAFFIFFPILAISVSARLDTVLLLKPDINCQLLHPYPIRSPNHYLKSDNPVR